MSTVIKIKRGTSTPTTSDIVSGEIAIDTSAQKLYINDSGSIKLIGDGTSGSSLTVQDEGSSLSTAATTLNFVGSGVTASGTGATKTITISGGGGGSDLTVAEDGSDLSTAATKLDFVGAGVTATGSGATKTITIPGNNDLTIQEEGSSLSTAATTLNFVGSNVTATGSGATKTITISGGSEITVQDEGSSLSTAASTLNFVGSGVVASGTGSTKTITISGGSGGVNVQGEVRAFTGDGSTTGFTVTSGANATNVMVFLNGVYQRPTNDYTVSGTTLTFGTAPANGEVVIIKEILESSAVDLTSISTDLTPDTHNEYDVGQLGSAFRDFTFVRKIQKNVEIFTNAIGLGTVAANLGFNINTSAANMTQVFTNAGGLDNPVLGGGNATFDDNNPAFLF